MTRAAIGFRAHSGWAALVVVGGAPRSPAVLDRRRIELIPPGGLKQPFHAAESLELKQAEKLIQRSTDEARQLARRGLRAVLEDLRKKDVTPVGCGLLLSSGRPLTTLAATLASHALIHTAEGELFREALIRASRHHHLPVTGVKERELWTRAAAALPISADALQRRIAEMGRDLGPPWSQDEKFAALVAWLALAAAPRAR